MYSDQVQLEKHLVDKNMCDVKMLHSKQTFPSAYWKQIGSKLVADWKQTGIRLESDWNQTISRQQAEWKQTGSRMEAEWKQNGRGQ